jgi:hypothetical protein
MLKATDDADAIGRECVRMFRDMRIKILEIRGVGISINKLEPAGGKDDGGKSIVDMFANAKSKEVKKVESFASAEDSASGGEETFVDGRAQSAKPDLDKAMAAKPQPAARASASSTDYSMTAGELDESVLKELPPEMQAEIRRQFKLPPAPGVSATGINPFARTAAAAKGKHPAALKSATVNPKDRNQVQQKLGLPKHAGVAKHGNAVRLHGRYAEALPSPSQVDPSVFNKLPPEMRKELEDQWKRVQPGKRGAAVDRERSPIKKPKTDAAPATAYSAPSLMGKTDLDDVRDLIGEWISSCPDSGPVEDDCATFVMYCGDLIKEGMLEAIEAVTSYLYRHAKGKEGWKAEVAKMMEKVQVQVKGRYGCESAVISSFDIYFD